MRAVPRLCVLYSGIRLATEEKKTRKKPVRVVEKNQLGTIQYVDMANFWQVATTSLSIPIFLGTS
jgi:hypothetical protein